MTKIIIEKSDLDELIIEIGDIRYFLANVTRMLDKLEVQAERISFIEVEEE